MTLNAHLDIAQLVAFKLFDSRHGTMTVTFLLDRAEALKNSFANATPTQVEAVINTARVQITNLDAPLKKIHAKRSRLLAHLDPTIVTAPDELAKKISLTFSDLNLVLNTAGQILNEVSVAFRDSSPLYELIGADDYKTAVSLIADAKCAQVREYEAEFGSWEQLRPRKCQ